MSQVPDTELFSAYLDGELTADEQVRVEQMLAASMEARQLLEELRALGNTLQSLPQQKLAEDLSARVLEIARRRMLAPDDGDNRPSAGRAAQSLKPPRADDIGWLGIAWREISWRGMVSKRALVCYGVVVITVVIIAYTLPPPPKETQIAMGEKPPVPAAPAASKDKPSKPSASDGRWVGEKPRLEKARKEKLELAGALAADSKSGPAAAAVPPAPPRFALSQPQAPMDAAKPGGGPSPASAALVMSKTAATPTPRGTSGPDAAKRQMGKDAAEGAASVDQAVVEETRGQQLLNGGAPAMANVTSSPSGQASATIFVRLDVSAVAVGNKVFEGLLARNGLGRDQDLADLTGNVVGAGSRSGGAGLGGLGGGQARDRQESSVDKFGGMKGDVLRSATDGSASSRTTQRQQAASQTELPAVHSDNSSARRNEGIGQSQPPPTHSQAPTYKRNVPNDGKQSLTTGIAYQFDASPEQLASLMQQIGESPDAFSTPQYGSVDWASPPARRPPENNQFPYSSPNAYAKDGAEYLNRQVGQQKLQARPGATASDTATTTTVPQQAPSRYAAFQAKPGAMPARGGAKQHVVFVLIVVDRLPPAATVDFQAPALASPPPSKQ